MPAPKTAWFCTHRRYSIIVPRLCTYHIHQSNCFLGSKCIAKQYAIVPLSINPKLIEKIEILLESYEKAEPPMDRPKFSEALIKICRGIK